MRGLWGWVAVLRVRGFALGVRNDRKAEGREREKRTHREGHEGGSLC